MLLAQVGQGQCHCSRVQALEGVEEDGKAADISREEANTGVSLNSAFPTFKVPLNLLLKSSTEPSTKTSCIKQEVVSVTTEGSSTNA